MVISCGSEGRLLGGWQCTTLVVKMFGLGEAGGGEGAVEEATAAAGERDLGGHARAAEALADDHDR